MQRCVLPAVLAAILAGCGLRQPLPTFRSLAPGVPPGIDLVAGRLTDVSGCVQLVTEEPALQPSHFALLWEPGWSVAYDPLRIYNDDALVASAGQTVWLGGMFGAGDGQVDPACATADAFRVTSVMTTNPIDPP